MTSDRTVEVTYPESSSGARLLMGILTFKSRNKPDIDDIDYFLVVKEGKVTHLSEVSPSPGETWDGTPGSLTQVRALLRLWTAGLVNCYITWYFLCLIRKGMKKGNS